MKKIVTLAIALLLTACLATAAFAATEPTMIYDASVPTDVVLGAGATAEYQAYAYGMVMTITNAADLTVTVDGEACTADSTGVIVTTLPAGNPRMTPPPTISITNNSDAKVTAVMSFSYAKGHMENPATLALGVNSVDVPGDGYHFTYTAIDAGVLLLRMEGKNWTVTINNLTTYTYGDAVYSSDGATYVAAAIAPDDELQIVVGTEDWSVANISFSAAEVEHVLEHHEAVEVGCHTDGMQEYWYCQYCDVYFADAEAKYPVARLSLVIPAESTLEHHEAVEVGCHTDGMQEYWYCADCDCYFTDAEGKYNIGRLSLVIPAENTLEYHKEVPAVCHINGNVEYYYCAGCDCYFTDVEGNLVNTNAKNIIIPGSSLEHHEAVEVGCHTDGMQEYWYCADCDCYFTDAEGKYNIGRLSLVIPAENTLEYHKEVPAVCHINGNVEYYYCAGCDCYFTDVEGNLVNTNAKNIIIPGSSLEHHEAVEVGCHTNGMQEYWYCADCDCYFTDAEGKYNIGRLSLTIPAEHTLEHHEAVDPGCHRNGNMEYWYCAGCDCYFIDVEGNMVNSNAKNIVILADSTLEHHEAVAATCEKDGMKEYWYCADCDCYFTDAEGKYNIARLSLVDPATGHSYVDGVCENCGKSENDNPSTGDMGILMPAMAALISLMGTVAVVAKKKED